MSTLTSVTLHPRQADPSNPGTNPLPQVLQTPAGLALLELQGTVNFPHSDAPEDDNQPRVAIGRFDFPDYRPDALDPSNTSWMRRAYMYVGQHQRLTGEVKKLPKPVAVVRRRDVKAVGEQPDQPAEELEVVDIVKYKLVFSQRPEPVGTAAAS